MNKKLLSCISAIALCCVFAFSASAVCARNFAADVILPFEDEILTSSEATSSKTTSSETTSVETTSSEATSGEAVTDAPEEPTIVLYASEQPTTQTRPITDDASGQSLVKPVLICVLIGLVIALIVTLSVKSSYKPVRRKRDAAQYLVDGSVRVTASDETLVRSDVSERTIENKTSSGE